MKTRLHFPLQLLLFLVLNLWSVSYATRVERSVDTWQPTHYLVTIALDDQLSTIDSATTVIDILVHKPTSTIDLDFGDLTVDSVTLDAKPAVFTHNNGRLQVTTTELIATGKRLQVAVQYHGKPKDGLILTADKDGNPSAIGDNWPNRVHHWIPTLDHPSAKATVTFNITAPAGDEVVANGKLDRVMISGTHKIWTYTEGVPIPPYCMIIGVGQFARLAPAERTATPLSYYVPHVDAPYALKGFAPSIPTVTFFSEMIAPYPYEKLALIVGATRFGGMENSSAIVFTSTLFNARQSPAMSQTFGIPIATTDVISHEIAHQWFGDSVTESTWSDLWLSEGFATYFAGLFLQRYESEAAFQRYMKDAADRVIAYEKEPRAPIFDRDTEDLMKLLNANNYQKGAWVLHMLRSRLGDDAFFRGLRGYYRAHANGNASTKDLRAALEKSSGTDLRAFFARWVYDSGHPQYELSWFWLGRKELKVVLVQRQPGNVFADPVPVTIRTAHGTRDVVLKPTSKLWIEQVPLRDKPLGVEIDPRNTLLEESRVVNP